MELVDDPERIPDDSVLYRRTTWDKIGGRPSAPNQESKKISPNFFTDAPEAEAARFGFDRVCMSVGVSTLLTDPPAQMLSGFAGMGLVSVTAGQLRNLTKGDGTPCPQGVMLAPTDAEPWHAVVFGLSEAKRSAAAAKAVARCAVVVVPLRTE